MENFMMINGIFNRIGITSNYLRLMACKMLCMCFIISTLAFAQRSNVINNTSARNNHLESGIVLPAPIGDLNGSNASRTACFSHGMTNSNWITGFWGPDSGSTEPPTFAALHSFSPGPMELEEAIIHGYYSTDDTTTARAQVFVGVADINGTTIETIASDIIYFNIGEEGPWTTASIDLSWATYYSTDSTFLKIVWSPLDDGYSSLFGANMWIPGQRIDDPNIYVPNGLSGWDSAGVYFASDWYNYVIEICGTPSNITMAGIEIEEVEAYPGDDVQVGIFFDGQGQTGGTFTGEYYNGSTGGSPEFGELVLVREDFEINFDWGIGSPDPLVQNDGFQVRWTGTIYAEESGTYYFRAYTDDGLRLFIDEQSVIDEWWDFPATNHYGQIELDPGLHDLEMEYYENGGDAVALLYWIPPNGVETLVEPSDQVALNSAEFQFDGFQDFDVDFTGITLEGTQLGDLDWAVEFNNTDSMLYVALAGADGINIADLNTLFWLEFHVHDDAMLGDIPIDFAGGILNTESPYWEVEPGGIWVMDPNNPPGGFELLTPSDGFTLSITQDNINASTAFTWGESVDPDGDDIDYIVYYWPIMLLPDGSEYSPGYVFNYTESLNSFDLSHQDVVEALSEVEATTANVWWQVAATDGEWFPSLDFYGDGHAEVENNDNLNFGTGDFAVSLWFKHYGYWDSLQVVQQLFAKHDGGSDSYELQLWKMDDDMVFLDAIVGEDIFSSEVPFHEGHLYHLVLSRTNGLVTIFMDGANVGEMESNGNTTSNGNLVLGYDTHSYDENLSGSMTDVTVYSSGLADESVSIIYEDGPHSEINIPEETNLVAHWPMDVEYSDPSNPEAPMQDIIGGNNGTLTNAWWAAVASGYEMYADNGGWWFSIDISGALSIDDISMPMEYALHQNYPNPFNPITTIRYDLPEAGYVNVVIYDMMGHQIKQLISGTEDAGHKSVVWDSTNDYGRPVSAGVYMYRIQTGEYIQTKKMVLLK
tara:strand:- start:65 stop:3028 length:2964 start_codon:yes stop_codon:yes gene_type:complete